MQLDNKTIIFKQTFVQKRGYVERGFWNDNKSYFLPIFHTQNVWLQVHSFVMKVSVSVLCFQRWIYGK